MLFRLDSFRGTIPIVDPQLLPDNAAQTAMNCELFSGGMHPIKGTTYVNTPIKAGTKKSIYRFDTDYWFHWLTDVDCIRGPVSTDSQEVTYWTGDGVPKVADSSVSVAGPFAAFQDMASGQYAVVSSHAVIDIVSSDPFGGNTGVLGIQPTFSYAYLSYGGSTTMVDCSFASDLTIDFDIYVDSIASGDYLIISNYGPNSIDHPTFLGGWYIALSTTGGNRLKFSTQNSYGDTLHTYSSAVGSITTGSWLHCSLVRSSGVMQWYVEGSASGSSDSYATLISPYGFNLFIGYNQFPTLQPYYTGKLAHIRISDIARWTTTYTPPTGPYTTATGGGNDANCLFYAPMSSPTDVPSDSWTLGVPAPVTAPVAGTGDFFNDLSTGGADSPRTVTAYGSPTIDIITADPFAGHAGVINLDGADDYLSYPNSADFDFGTGDFTIDFWLNSTALSTGTLFSRGRSSGSVGMGMEFLSGSRIRFYLNANSEVVISGADMASGVWKHVALVKTSGVYQIYVGGTASGASVADATSISLTGAFLLGRIIHSSADFYTGKISNFRVSKISRWSTTFTPPIAPYTTATGQNDSDCIMYLPLAKDVVIGDPDLAEDRAYIVTAVCKVGNIEMEGPPSPASNIVTVGDTQAVNIVLPDVVTGDYNYFYKRIYRTASSGTAGSTEYKYVAQVAYAVQTYADSKLLTELGDAIQSTDYDPPPTDLHSLHLHPGGFMVGASGLNFCASVAYQPHAWPTAYQIKISHPIVGIGIFGTSILVTTTAYPFLFTGITPDGLSVERIEIRQSCTSKRGMVDMGSAVAYPSPDGLMAIGLDGAKNVTEKLMSRDQWQALVPSTILGAFQDGKYHGFYNSTGCFVIDMAAEDLTFSDVVATARFTDPVDDTLYLQVGDYIVSWKTNATKKTAVWKSKVIVTPRPMNFAACQVFAESYPVTLKVYADSVLQHTQTVADRNPFYLPAGFMADRWEVELTSTVNVNTVLLAETMRELR